MPDASSTSVVSGGSGSRLGGVDALRLIAVTGVIVIHLQPKDEPMRGLEQFCRSFSVSFFYMAAFFFLARQLSREASVGPLFQRRLRQLLIPYLVWTAIYVVARLAKHLSTYVWPDSVGGWLQLVCFGGAALHLYFLPSLMAGTTLSFALAPLARRLKWEWLLLLGAAALLPFAGIIHQAAFRPLVAPLPENLAIRITALAADTLPYILVAFGSQGFVKKYASNPSGSWWGALMLVTGLTLAFSAGYAPVPGLEHILTPLCGCLVFSGSLFLSAAFPDRAWLTRLGRSVFGVYLVHHLLIEGFEMATNRYHSSWLETYHWPQILVMTMLVLAASVVLSLGFQERIWTRFARRPA